MSPQLLIGGRFPRAGRVVSLIMPLPRSKGKHRGLRLPSLWSKAGSDGRLIRPIFEQWDSRAGVQFSCQGDISSMPARYQLLA